VSAEDYSDAQSKVANSKIIDSIKEQTKSQLEHRENLQKAQEEYNNYISTVKKLYGEYQNLSAQENLSSEQKTQLQGVVEQLQGKMSGLNVSIDENGKAHITNAPLIEANIQKLTSEGMTVENLSSVRITDAKVTSEWMIGNTQVTYSEITKQIEIYKAGIKAIQQYMQAKILASAGGDAKSEQYQHMSIAQAQSIEANDPQYKDYQEQADKLREFENAKKQIDDLYSGVGSVPYSGGGSNIPSASGDYMPSGDDSKSKKKKAQEELEKSEKKMVDDITDAYNKAKDIISNDIEEIDAKITGLGDSDSSNFTDRVKLTTQKIDEQNKIVQKAQEQLNALKNVSVSTAEAQEALENATLKASKELRQETLEVAKLQSEIEKADVEQLKKMYDDQKQIESGTIDAQQKKQTQDLENIKTKQEELHQTKMDNYEAELDALTKSHEEEEKANDLQEKKNDLKQKEIELENLKNQKTIKYAKENADHTWSYVGEVNQEEISKKQKEVNEAKKAYDKEKSDQEYEKEKQAIEANKTAEEKAYNSKKKYLEQYSTALKESQDRDKKRVEAYYSDIDKLAKDQLNQLKETYDKNWNSIADSISISVTKVTKQLQDLRTLQSNFTATEVDGAINSGNISGYLDKNQSKMNNKSSVNENDINNHLKSIDADAKNASGSIDDLTDSYNKLLSIKKDTDITDNDVTERKTKVNKITKVDSDGQTTQLQNIKDTNKSIEEEQDGHYNKELTRQNKAQTDEYNSAVTFANKFVTFEDKFLELVQMVWDFRFGNIVNITQSSMGYVMEALVECHEAFESFRDMMSKMKVDIADVDISDIQARFNAYKQEVVGWIDSKKGLYDNSNNPLYNKDVYDQYKSYANVSGYSVNSSILNGLSGSGTTSTVNNNNKSLTSSNAFSFNNVTIKADNPEQLWSQILTQAKQTEYLKSTD